jgi:myo-inositol-1(or 4)-monophosphatase
MDPLLSTAVSAAEAAAEVHLRHFGAVGVDRAQEKAHSDFVSEVDFEAQDRAIAVIRTQYPEHRILAEEEAGSEPVGTQSRLWPEDGTPVWIIDPLDGTTNYLHGHPHFAASVAVGRLAAHDTRPGSARNENSTEPRPGGVEGPGSSAKGILEAGAVVAPRTGERWWASRGNGAWKNGKAIQVSGLRTLRSALVGTGFPFKKPELVTRYLTEFQRVLPASGGVRRCGSAAMDLCYLAEGVLDAFWEEDYLSPWDVAAGLVILKEAGGMATRLNGQEIDLENGSILAANSPALLDELGRLVRAP